MPPPVIQRWMYVTNGNLLFSSPMTDSHQRNKKGAAVAAP
tara:strand:- start:426 stop:545 length:120 start_codon:yes stop_codon:yes gene_type:complete